MWSLFNGMLKIYYIYEIRANEHGMYAVLHARTCTCINNNPDWIHGADPYGGLAPIASLYLSKRFHSAFIVAVNIS